MPYPHRTKPSADEVALLSGVAGYHTPPVVITAAGAVSPKGGFYKIVSAATSAIALTIAAPVPGAIVDIEMVSIGGGGTFVLSTPAGVHMVAAADLAATTNTATFNAANDRLVMVALDANHWFVTTNVSVTLTTV